jgi:hypothetical protein
MPWFSCLGFCVDEAWHNREEPSHLISLLYCTATGQLNSEI